MRNKEGQADEDGWITVTKQYVNKLSFFPFMEKTY